MTLEQLLDSLRQNPGFMENVTAWRTIEKRDASYAPFPKELDKRLLPALEKHHIYQLYTHQADAFRAISEGKDIVIVTPTASGKTLCYNLPVLNEILRNPDTRSLYLFPTKALSADQALNTFDIKQQ